jgi:SAM-dependent methyltransferase
MEKAAWGNPAEAVHRPFLVDAAHPSSPLGALLLDLYQKQLAVLPQDVYLLAHAQEKVVSTHVAVFDFYSAYLPTGGRILDWGCRHAADACLIRAKFGPDLRLDGCDFVEAGTYGVFHDFAGLEYQQLGGVVELPYADGSFDAVVGSGTLEHVAMDYESLKELYRVMKPNGLLVITDLPNWLSYEEWYKRTFGAEVFHRRLYGLREILTLLKRTGFYPKVAGYQTRLDILPALSFFHRTVRLASWALPVHRFCSTLCLVAEKVPWM